MALILGSPNGGTRRPSWAGTAYVRGVHALCGTVVHARGIVRSLVGNRERHFVEVDIPHQILELAVQRIIRMLALVRSEAAQHPVHGVVVRVGSALGVVELYSSLILGFGIACTG